MRRRDLFTFSLMLVSLLGSARADEPTKDQGRAEDERAIRAVTKQYLAALERGDGKTLATFWTEDGDFVDERGRSYPARESVLLVEKPVENGPKNSMKTASTIRFLTADVAIEDGTSEIVQPARGDIPLARGRFAATWVKTNGNWRLARLREVRLDPPRAAAHLADFEKLVGHWVGRSGETQIEIIAHFNPTGTYLLREIRGSRGDAMVFSASQRIGWDPASDQVRSWTFDLAGGHSDGLWYKSGETWIMRSTGVLSDERRTSSTNTLTFKDADHFHWKSTAAYAGDQPMPELDIPFERQADE